MIFIKNQENWQRFYCEKSLKKLYNYILYTIIQWLWNIYKCINLYNNNSLKKNNQNYEFLQKNSCKLVNYLYNYREFSCIIMNTTQLLYYKKTAENEKKYWKKVQNYVYTKTN